ncbi:unnamed protein product [Trichobilharzia regenti]|nr:unnamed protein product [Trichobilharzia regenti]
MLGSQFALAMRFVDHVYENQVVQDLTLKIVLPETVSDVQFVPPFPVREQYFENMKTYLDTTGRTVIVIKGANLVEEHIQDFKDEKSELRLRAQTLVDEAQALLSRRSSLYQSYEDILLKYKGSKNSTQFTADRRKLETDHKSVTQQLLSVQNKMADLYTDGVEKVS